MPKISVGGIIKKRDIIRRKRVSKKLLFDKIYLKILKPQNKKIKF